MFENDYIMRLIHEMVRAVLKLVFRIDTESVTEDHMEDLVKDQGDRELTVDLLQEIDRGNINGAENELYQLLEDRTREHLLIGLIFYSHLNEKDDAFLKEHDFSRAEVRSGLEDLMNRYGIEGMENIFSIE